MNNIFKWKISVYRNLHHWFRIFLNHLFMKWNFIANIFSLVVLKIHFSIYLRRNHGWLWVAVNINGIPRISLKEQIHFKVHLQNLESKHFLDPITLSFYIKFLRAYICNFIFIYMIATMCIYFKLIDFRSNKTCWNQNIIIIVYVSPYYYSIGTRACVLYIILQIV